MMAAAALIAAALAVPFGAASASPYERSEALADAIPGAAGGLGQAVSISADGSVAVVGEPNAGGGAGAALVYANSNGAWTLAQRLTPGSEVGAGHFGAAVSMDGTGEALLVGAPDDRDGKGSAWVFVLSGGIWTSQAQLVDTRWEDGAGRFGASVAVANGGYLALVGDPMSSQGTGDAVTFWADYTSHVWSEHQHMHAAGPGNGEHFGASVAVGNNTPAYIGAPGAAGGDGAVYRFTYYGIGEQDWQPPTTLRPPVGDGSFGAGVAVVGMTGDVIVGAPLAGGVGAAYQYRSDGMQEWRFTDPAPSAGGGFGSSVAVAGESLDKLVIGAPGDNAGAGAAYSFDGAFGDNWTPGSAMSPATAPAMADGFGSAVAVSSVGSDALVGAPGASSRDGAVTTFVARDLTVPEPPQEVSATAAAESATVRWIAPDHTGGAPITSYTVTSSPGGLTCAAASDVSCTVTGLTDGQRYTFTVTATNRVGASRPSAASPAVVPQGGHGGGGSGGDDGGGSGSGSGDGGNGGGTGGGGGGPSGGDTGGGSGGGSGGSGGTGGGGSGTGGGTGGGAGGGGGPSSGASGRGDRSGGGSASRRDTTPPARPRGVRATKRTGTSITLAWGPSSDESGVVAYRIYEFAHGRWTPVGSTAASRHSFVRTGLRHGTRHRIEIRAVDGAGNLSAPVIGAWATVT